MSVHAPPSIFCESEFVSTTCVEDCTVIVNYIPTWKNISVTAGSNVTAMGPASTTLIVMYISVDCYSYHSGRCIGIVSEHGVIGAFTSMILKEF
jgi:hypothetical protein